MKTSQIVLVARSVIGVPFKHQGRNIEAGLDCAGLVAYILTQLNIPYIDQYGYSRQPHQGLLESTLDIQPSMTKVFDMQPGDFLLMKFFKAPQHLAVYTGDTIVHSWETVGKVCEHRLDSMWSKRIVSIYRLNNLGSE